MTSSILGVSPESRSAKTSWIEIDIPGSRPPRGLRRGLRRPRGLKSGKHPRRVRGKRSRSAKTSWIEIMRSTQAEERYESRSAKTSWIEISQSRIL